jgi:hypothetical protein
MVGEVYVRRHGDVQSKLAGGLKGSNRWGLNLWKAVVAKLDTEFSLYETHLSVRAHATPMGQFQVSLRSEYVLAP